MRRGARVGKVLGAFFALFLAQCSEAPRSHQWFAMDTNMAVTLFGKKGPLADDKVFARVDAETSRLESLFTDYSATSGLALLRGHAGDTLSVDPQIYQVLASAVDMGRASGGAFDITLHDLKILWGLDGAHTGNVPTSRALDSVLRGNPVYKAPAGFMPPPPLDLLPGNRVVLRRENVPLDLGGIAKGFIVDRLHALLDSLGYPNHIVQAGGDIRVGGQKPSGAWSIGIRHPRNEDSLAGTLAFPKGTAISTAGDYERFFIRDDVRYHHIFNPRTGIPVHGVAGVTVVASTSLAADAIDDALFVLGPERGTVLAQAYGVQAVWFVETPQGLCAVETPGMKTLLTLNGVGECPIAGSALKAR